MPVDTDGDLNGMSHSGTGFALVNRGEACRLPALPQMVLRDARGHALPAARRAPVGMHPGPVMVPLKLEKGARAQGTLRWVSGPVYDNSRKLTAARLSVGIGTGWVSMPLKVVLYAPADQGRASINHRCIWPGRTPGRTRASPEFQPKGRACVNRRGPLRMARA
jgi:hypothetical protein